MLEVSASGSCSIMKCLWVCARKRWIYRCTIPDQTMSIIWLVVLVNCGSFIFWHHMPGLTEKKGTESCSFSVSYTTIHFFILIVTFWLSPLLSVYFVSTPNFNRYENKSTEANLKCYKFVCSLSLPLLFPLLLLSIASLWYTNGKDQGHMQPFNNTPVIPSTNKLCRRCCCRHQNKRCCCYIVAVVFAMDAFRTCMLCETLPRI